MLLAYVDFVMAQEHLLNARESVSLDLRHPQKCEGWECTPYGGKVAHPYITNVTHYLRSSSGQTGTGRPRQGPLSALNKWGRGPFSNTPCRP